MIDSIKVRNKNYAEEPNGIQDTEYGTLCYFSTFIRRSVWAKFD